MPLNKAIFTVEVDDSKFKEFRALFDRYQEAVKNLPKDWAEVGKGVIAAGLAQEALTGSLKEQVALLVKQELASKKIANNSDEVGSKWSGIVNKFREIDRSLERGTIKMVKWGALATGVLGGLSALGVGASLWGLDRMAAAVTATRRTAMGLGTTYGQFQSANVNYSRLISSPSSLLSGVANAKYDITSPEYTALLASGVSPSTLKNGNTGDIATAFLERLPQLFKGVPKGMWGATAKAYGVDQVMPMSDITAFLNASPEERKQMIDKQREDAKRMDVTDEASKKWADFSTQMDRAMKAVEATFMTKLAAIEPGLEKLSGVIVHAIEEFGKSDTLKGWLESLGHGIETLANYIGSKDFQTDVKNFGNWIGEAAEKIWAFVTGFNLITPAKAGGLPSSSVLGKGGDQFKPGDYVDSQGRVVHTFGSMSGRGGLMNRLHSRGAGGGSPSGEGPPGSTSGAMAAAMDQLRKEGVPEDKLHNAAAMLVGQAIAESGLRPGISHDHGTGYGVYGARLERRDAMLAWLAANGYAKDSLEGQMRYMAHEAMTNSRFARTRDHLMRGDVDPGSINDVTGNFESPTVINDRRASVNSALRAPPLVDRHVSPEKSEVITPKSETTTPKSSTTSPTSMIPVDSARRFARITIRENPGNDPVRAHAQMANPTTAAA